MSHRQAVYAKYEPEEVRRYNEGFALWRVVCYVGGLKNGLGYLY